MKYLAFLLILVGIFTAPCFAQSDGETRDSEALILEAKALLEEANAMLAKEEDASESGTSDSELLLGEGQEQVDEAASSGFTKFDALIAGLSIFALAVFVGFEVITKVPPTLHTPLMSGSNAISGITVVGALLVAGRSVGWFSWSLGILAVIFAMINVIGGFWVTHRMLSMFKR